MEITRLIKSFYTDRFPTVVNVGNGIIWRIDIRNCLEYRSNCIYVNDSYLREMREEVINNPERWNGNINNKEDLLSLPELGYLMAINKEYVGYSSNTLYESNKLVLNKFLKVEEYKDWIIKGLLE